MTASEHRESKNLDLPQFGVKSLPEPLPEKVESKHDDEDRRARDDREPRGIKQIILPVRKDVPPRRIRWRDAEAEKGQARLGQDSPGDPQGRRNHDRGHGIRDEVAEDDLVTRHTERVRRLDKILLAQRQDLGTDEAGRSSPTGQANHHHNVPDRRLQDGHDGQDQKERRKAKHHVNKTGDDGVHGHQPEWPDSDPPATTVSASARSATSVTIALTLGLTRSIRAGYALSQAVQVVGEEMPDPTGEEFRRVGEELRAGLEPGEALSRLLRRAPTDDVWFFCTAVNIQRSAGGNLAEILDGLSEVIRERFKILSHARALSAQARWTAVIVGLAPLFFAILFKLLQPDFFDPLLASPLAPLLITAGLISQAIGFVCIWRIANIKV